MAAGVSATGPRLRNTDSILATSFAAFLPCGLCANASQVSRCMGVFVHLAQQQLSVATATGTLSSDPFQEREQVSMLTEQACQASKVDQRASTAKLIRARLTPTTLTGSAFAKRG